MKKIIAAILAVMMIAAMSTTAFAAEGTGSLNEKNGTSKSIDVTAKYTEGLETVNTISVNVSWGAMEFTYHVGGTKTWNPETHQYDVDSKAVWQAVGNTVTVENHSDVAVDVKFEYAPEQAYSAIKCAFDVEESNLAAHPKAADPNSTAPAASVTAELKVTEGTLDSGIISATKIGTITVTIGE